MFVGFKLFSYFYEKYFKFTGENDEDDKYLPADEAEEGEEA